MSPKKDNLGKPLRYEPDFQGSVKRSCTDIFCLLVFIIFVAAWVTIGIYAFKNGDTSLLLVPRDTEGRYCGVDTDLEDKKYLLFFDVTKCAAPDVLLTGCKTPQVCVDKCPSEMFLYNESLSLGELRKKLICNPIEVKDKDKLNAAEIKEAIDTNKCAKWYLPSVSVYRRCFPVPDTDISFFKDHNIIPDDETYNKALENMKRITQLSEFSYMIVEDITTSGWLILIGLVVAMLFSLFYIILMRWITPIMVYISILGVIAALSYAIYFCTAKYDNLKDLSVEELPPESTFESYLAWKNMWLAGIIICSVLLAVILLVIIFLRKRIVLAIALIQEGSKAVASITSSLFFPIFPWVLQIAVLVFTIISAVYLSSIGDTKYVISGNFTTPAGDNDCKCDAELNYYEGAVCDPEVFEVHCHAGNTPCTDVQCHYIGVLNLKYIKYLQTFNIIIFIWIMCFVSALGEMVLAGTFATWFWTFHKHDVPFFTLTTSCYRTFRYHLGTLAFGSLIITICRIIRLILEYIDRKLKKFDNSFTRAIMCALKCCFWCFEKFIKFINRNAYIICAIYGKNFCSSAKEAFTLLMRNALRVFVLDKVTDFLFFLGKVFITLTITFASYFFFTHHQKDIDMPNLHYDFVPVVLIGIGTYFIASIFFSVYGMAVETLFLCFLEDCEKNDGSAEKPYFMSKELMKILGKRNKIE